MQRYKYFWDVLSNMTRTTHHKMNISRDFYKIESEYAIVRGN